MHNSPLLRKRLQQSRRRSTSPPRTSFTPRLENLEGRRLLAATIFEVTNTADSGDGSLRNAIESANLNPGPDKIEFASDVTGVIELTSGQLAITDDLTIAGPGSDTLTVSGGGSSRVFAVLPASLAGSPFATPTLAQVGESPEVSIEKLSISSGLATDALGFDPADPTNPGFAFGGGIFNLGGTLHLDRVVMSGNTAAGAITAGGAVANEFGGTLTVTRSHFENNTSAGFLIAAGGAITSDLGPAIDVATEAPTTTGQPEVEIDRSQFVNNSATATAGYIDGVGFSGLGGGGAILNVTGLMSIERSHFEGNSANGGTGGEGSTLGGPAFGGAVLSGNISPFGSAPAELHVSRSSFEGNQANGGDSVVAGVNAGQASGGAIAIGNLSESSLRRNEFLENVASGGDAATDANGGIGTGGGVAVSGGATASLHRNDFAGNRAEGGQGAGSGTSAAGRGGGLGLAADELAGFVPGPGSADSHRDRYEGNLATGGGGGIFNDGELSVSKASLVDNTAVGQADVLIDFYPGYVFQGGALGGGISNIGSLEVSDSTFKGNAAIGADGATGPNVLTLPPDTAVPTYPGLAVGGGLHNITEATVVGSRLVDNHAVAGDGNVGSFAGVANGGGIYNDGAILVRNSALIDNRSVGGNDNVGDLNAGGGYGGGLTSGSVAALLGLRSASAEISRTSVRGNEAVGGDGNASLFPVPPAHSAGNGVGGGVIVYQGQATIERVDVSRNSAIGGVGGLGYGGGIFAFGFVGSVDVEVSRSVIRHNVAIGGDGGDGLGGGLAAGNFGSFFGGSSNLSVARSLVFANLARGGDGGDGLGGGIYNDSDATLELTRSLVFLNRAVAGSGGEGVGGGIYNLGVVDEVRSRIFANFATTSDDDCFGC